MTTLDERAQVQLQQLKGLEDATGTSGERGAMLTLQGQFEALNTIHDLHTALKKMERENAELLNTLDGMVDKHVY